MYRELYPRLKILTDPSSLSSLASRDATEEENTKAMSAEKFKEALSAIKELSLAFDFNGADTIIKMIEEEGVPKEFNGMFKSVKSAVTSGDAFALKELLK